MANRQGLKKSNDLVLAEVLDNLSCLTVEMPSAIIYFFLFETKLNENNMSLPA